MSSWSRSGAPVELRLSKICWAFASAPREMATCSSYCRPVQMRGASSARIWLRKKA